MISVKLCTQEAGSVIQSCKCIAGWQPHVCACAFVFNCDVCKNLFYIGMSLNYCWRRKLYGYGRKVIERLHRRHKQCLWGRDWTALSHPGAPDDASSELVHKYEVSGACNCHNHTLVFGTRRHSVRCQKDFFVNLADVCSTQML